MFVSSVFLLSALPLAVLGGSLEASLNPRRHMQNAKGFGGRHTTTTQAAPTTTTAAHKSASTTSAHKSASSSKSSGTATAINPVSTSSFKLTDSYAGDNFFDGWDFFTGEDPTHGLVNYLSKSDAESAGLAYTSNGQAILAVDSTNWVSVGSNRDSVRIGTSNSYDGGLFIADIAAMPHGCATWPAWWSVGPDWPNGGEIDVIEGVNLNSVNQYTLHTSDGCTLDQSNSRRSELFSASVLGTQCASSNSDNNGCAFLDPESTSYGAGFNSAGGGVYAHLWDSTGIKVWWWTRSAVPSDITSGSPDPSGWGTPVAFWSSATCDMAGHFYQHSLVFDTTLGGDWAGNAFGSSGCSGSVEEAIADPSNFADAKWVINGVYVYNQ